MTHDSQPRTRKSSSVLLAILPAALLGFLIGVGVLYWFLPLFAREKPDTDPAAVERKAEPRVPLDSEENEAVQLFKNVKDSVVNVDTVVLRRGLDMRIQEQQAGTGSGFLWDDDGRIVTNFHVVKEAIVNNLGLRVVLADRTAYSAVVVGAAPDSDLAVIRIDVPKEKLKKIRVGSSKDLEVGQKVYAIGNPFGLSLSMTKGIISAVDRSIESPAERPIHGVIQIDAPINPGNSGGPLLDKAGRLIGVNTAIASPSGGNVGIGFAIPVDTVNNVVTELIRHGRILQPDSGILRLVDQRRLRRAGYTNGVMIQDVDPQSPAAKAGLQGIKIDPDGTVTPGDIVTAVDGEPTTGNNEFIRKLSSYKPGDKVKFTIERGERRFDVEITLRGV